MDSKLGKRLSKAEEQHHKLSPIIDRLKALEAHEEVLWAKLYLETKGQGPQLDRESMVYASEDWINFSKALAQAKADFINEQRWFDIRMKAYDAEHVTYKNESPLIKRQIG